MTALCGGGTSGPKPNTAVDVILTATQLASFLTSKVGLWAALVSGALGVLTFETAVFCSSDPPAQPTITPDEYKALLELGPPDLFQSALAKLRDLVLIAMWYELCACTSGTTPQPPPNLYTPPTGVGVQDYTTTPCVSPHYRIAARPNYFQADDSTNITQLVFPNLDFTTSVAVSGFPAQTIAVIPPSWTSLFGTLQYVSGTAPSASEGFGVQLLTYGPGKTPVSTAVDNIVSQVNQFDRDPDSGVRTINHATEAFFSLNTLAAATVTTTSTADWSLNVNCVGGASASIGCGADPILQALLNQILELCQRTREDVTLIQRYALPFAYVRGPSISGLTGTGSMALGRSVGLLIDVLGFPPANKQMLGEPPYIFDLGWVSALTPDGLVDEIRLTREHTTWLSKLIPSAELVGWGLRDGVQIRVTELHAEP